VTAEMGQVCQHLGNDQDRDMRLCFVEMVMR